MDSHLFKNNSKPVLHLHLFPVKRNCYLVVDLETRGCADNIKSKQKLSKIVLNINRKTHTIKEHFLTTNNSLHNNTTQSSMSLVVSKVGVCRYIHLVGKYLELTQASGEFLKNKDDYSLEERRRNVLLQLASPTPAMNPPWFIRPDSVCFW